MPKKEKPKKEKQKNKNLELKNSADETSAGEKEEEIFESKEVSSEKSESKEKKECPKLKDESKLIEEVEEQESASLTKFSNFLKTKSPANVLEKLSQEDAKNISLENEIGVAPKEKKEEKKYEEAIKYSIEEDYQSAMKRQREITPDMISQVASIPQIDFQKAGRGRIMPGQEFHMRAPAEMPKAPQSEKYDIVNAKKSRRFEGETTAFQEKLERRYENK